MRQTLALTSVWTLAIMMAVSACSSAKSGTSTTPDTTATVETPRSIPKTAPSSPPSSPPAVDVVARLIEDALRSDGSISYDDLVQRLGPPTQIDAEPIENAYNPNQVDTVRTITYAGLEALVYDVAFEPKSFLIRFSILSDRYATPEGIRIGDSRASVIDRLGPPTDPGMKPGELVYQESDATPSAMIVTVQSGQVTRVDWEFYFS